MEKRMHEIKFYVYILIDPRDATVRYVGKSYDPQKRLKQHLKCGWSDYNPQKAQWIQDLKIAGLEPILKILESFDNYWGVDEAEKKWIKFYVTRNVALLNLAAGGASRGRSRMVKAIPAKWVAVANRLKVIRSQLHCDLLNEVIELAGTAKADKLLKISNSFDSWMIRLMDEFCTRFPELAEDSGRIFQGDDIVESDLIDFRRDEVENSHVLLPSANSP